MAGMSSWTSRLNTVFSYFGVVMATLIAANVAATYFLRPDVQPKLRFNRLISLYGRASGA